MHSAVCSELWSRLHHSLFVCTVTDQVLRATGVACSSKQYSLLTKFEACRSCSRKISTSARRIMTSTVLLSCTSSAAWLDAGPQSLATNSQQRGVLDTGLANLLTVFVVVCARKRCCADLRCSEQQSQE